MHLRKPYVKRKAAHRYLLGRVGQEGGRDPDAFEVRLLAMDGAELRDGLPDLHIRHSVSPVPQHLQHRPPGQEVAVALHAPSVDEAGQAAAVLLHPELVLRLPEIKDGERPPGCFLFNASNTKEREKTARAREGSAADVGPTDISCDGPE